MVTAMSGTLRFTGGEARDAVRGRNGAAHWGPAQTGALGYHVPERSWEIPENRRQNTAGHGLVPPNAQPGFSESSQNFTGTESVYSPTIAFHRLAKSVRSFDVMSRAIASRLRMAVSGKMSGSSARAAVSSSLAEARMSWAAGTGQT